MVAGGSGEQGGVSDEQSGVAGGEHGSEVGSHFAHLTRAAVPVLQEHAGEDDGGARGGIGGDGANLLDGDFADEKDGLNGAAGGDGDVGNDDEIGNGRVGDGRDDADVGGAFEQSARTSGGDGVVDVEILGEFGGGLVLEAPHERCGVEK